MRLIIRSGVVVTACLAQFVCAWAASAIPGEHALREQCGALSQAGMRDCLGKKFSASEKALDQAERSAAEALSKWDEDDEYVKRARTKLADSNKEFARYRQQQCEFSSSLSGGGAGNAHEMRRLACAAALNVERAAHLRAAASELPSK